MSITDLLIGCTVLGTFCALVSVVIAARVMTWNAQLARRNELRDNAGSELKNMEKDRDYQRSRADELERELRETRRGTR